MRRSPAITCSWACSRNWPSCRASAASVAISPSSKAGACTPKRWAKTSASTPIPTTASATCTRACCVPRAWWPIPA
ncbi:hypothetical protein G6F61_015039 [Rhizopus arrhizus]|nr:hypothetical protein G6F61_015039 [Rhizopus arrhizus]KAG1386450.1 hypothetical protein G6F59_016855 [Rhizopus arrhizus]KAG1389853.1 hypothetical protein G6F58_013167 [Rhizopus delemar]